MTEKAKHLTPKQLAERWSLKPATLSQWRWNGRGPCYLEIGGRILYRPEDVVDFENRNLRKSTSRGIAL